MGADIWGRAVWGGATAKLTGVASTGGRIGWARIWTRNTDPQWITRYNAEAKSGATGLDRWQYEHKRTRPDVRKDWYKLRYDSHFDNAQTPMVTGSLTTLVIPYWAILLVLTILPGLWLVGFCRRRYRQRMGLCLECGWNLPSAVDRCPECGTPVPEEQKCASPPPMDTGTG